MSQKIRHIILPRWPFPSKREAVTIYPFIFYKSIEAKVKFWEHEMVHIDQVKRKGWLKFYGSYITEHLKKGYDGNKYEIEAREKDND